MVGCCKRIKNKFKLIILPGVIGVATSGLIFQLMYFIPSIQTPSTQIFIQTTAFVFYFMSLISYYFAINIKNDLPPTLILPRLKLQLKNNHPYYMDKKQCEKQNQKYKPPRTSHCHSCKCVARMDHHCPYTDNCVGARNIKAFVLFCLYGAIFALQFLVLSVFYYFQISAGKTAQISEFEVVLWMFLSFISFFLTCSMGSLAIGNIYLATKNITQLEMLKGIFFLRDKHGTHPNPFDLGFLSNLNIVFGGDYWLFWWPTQIKSATDFTSYPMRPPVTSAQIKQLPTRVQKELEDPFARSIPKSMDELRKQEQNKYEGVVFFYLGKQYQLTREQIKSQLAEINQIDIKDVDLDKKEGETIKYAHNSEDEEILTDIYKD